MRIFLVVAFFTVASGLRFLQEHNDQCIGQHQAGLEFMPSTYSHRNATYADRTTEAMLIAYISMNHTSIPGTLVDSLILEPCIRRPLFGCGRIIIPMSLVPRIYVDWCCSNFRFPSKNLKNFSALSTVPGGVGYNVNPLNRAINDEYMRIVSENMFDLYGDLNTFTLLFSRYKALCRSEHSIG